MASRGGVSSGCKGVCSRLVSSLGGDVTISDVPFTPWKGAGIVLNPAHTAVAWIEFKFNSDAPELILICYNRHNNSNTLLPLKAVNPSIYAFSSKENL